MAQLTIEQIAQAGWDAGFRGEALALALAIARGESGFDSDAIGDETLTNATWGPSIGLFQVRTLRDQTGTGLSRDIEQLADPRFNARAAWEISAGGTDFTPWSVYNHDRHLPFLDEARAVVGRLEAEGTLGAGLIEVPGSPPPADVETPADSDPIVDLAAPERGPTSEDQRLQAFLDAALAQRGDIYDFDLANAHDRTGANLDDPDPRYFDCSELVQWAAARAGIDFVDGSWNQYQAGERAGLDMPVEDALRTPGALLFKFSSDPMQRNRPAKAHVAISLGNGEVMEASSPSRGVDVFSAIGRDWTHAATIPGLGTSLPTPETVSTASVPYEQDTDMDRLRDQLEMFIGTDPNRADSDHDAFTDIDELVSFGTDPLDAASNPLSSPIPDLTATATPAVADDEVAALREVVVERFGLDVRQTAVGGLVVHDDAAAATFREFVSARYGVDPLRLDAGEVERFVVSQPSSYESLRHDYPLLPASWTDFLDEMHGR